MKELLNKILLTRSDNWAAVVLRIPIGIILVAHGCQKLFGWFGGYGLEGTGQWLASVGLAPGYLMALLAGSAEFFGGLGLILGLFTRVAAFVSALTMFIALFWVHWGNGFFLDQHGIEYALALSSATASLIFMGGGRFAIDNWLISNHIFGESS